MRTLLGLGAIVGAFWFATKCFAKCTDSSGAPVSITSQFTRNPGLRSLMDASTKKPAPVFGIGIKEPVSSPIVSNPISLPAPKRIVRFGTGSTAPNQPTYLG